MIVQMPLARTKDIIVQEVDDECLVYDLKTNKALCLNTVSAEIWKRCDGTTTVQEVAEILGKRMDIKLQEDFVWLAIADLEKNKLLEKQVAPPSDFENLSRRKVLVKYALPSLMLPIVASIVAPSAVQAQSGMVPTPTCQPSGTFFIAGNCTPSCSGQCASNGNTICCSMIGTLSGCGSFCTCQCA